MIKVDSFDILVGFVISGNTLYVYKFSTNVAMDLSFSYLKKSIFKSLRK